MRISIIFVTLVFIGIGLVNCTSTKNVKHTSQFMKEQQLTYNEIIGITIPTIAKYNKFVSYCYTDKQAKKGKYLCINKRFKYSSLDRGDVISLIRSIGEPCMVRDNFTMIHDTLLANSEIPIIFSEDGYTATFSPIMYNEDFSVFAGFFTDLLGQGWTYIIRRTKDGYKVSLNYMHRTLFSPGHESREVITRSWCRKYLRNELHAELTRLVYDYLEQVPSPDYRMYKNVLNLIELEMYGDTTQHDHELMEKFYLDEMTGGL